MKNQTVTVACPSKGSMQQRAFCWLDQALDLACRQISDWLLRQTHVRQTHVRQTHVRQAHARATTEYSARWVIYGLSPDTLELPELGIECQYFETHSSQSALNACLGQEVECVIYNAWAGFHPDRVAILSALVRAGGTMVLISPPRSEWALFQDPQYRRLISDTGSGVSQLPPSGIYLEFIVAQCQAAVLSGDMLESLPESPQPQANRSGCVDVLAATAQQQAVLHWLQEGVRQDAPARWWIQGGRGRGKSQVLCWFLEHFLSASHPQSSYEPSQQVVIIAPHAASTSLVESRLSQMDTVSGRWCICSPLAWLDNKTLQGNTAILLIEEAASQPFPCLMKLLAFEGHVIMATTTVGYEGSGRLLKERLRQRLNSTQFPLQTRTLTAPMRWAQGDRMEKLVNRLLLLDESCLPDHEEDHTEPVIHGERFEPQACHINWIDRRTLASDTVLLGQVWALLYAAHYRTRPSDLRALMDQPGVHILVAQYQGAVVGAAWFVTEGPFSRSLAEDILANRRRPAGHIIPQILGQRLGFRDALFYTYWRCVRIAVLPEFRRHGLGRKMIQVACDPIRSDSIGEQDCGQHSVAAFGVSCTLSQEHLMFWQSCGLRFVRLGARSHARTGQSSMLLLKAFTPSMVQWVKAAEQVLNFQLPFLSLEERSAQLKTLMIPGGCSELSDTVSHCYDRLRAFALGGGQLSDVAGLLLPFLKKFESLHTNHLFPLKNEGCGESFGPFSDTQCQQYHKDQNKTQIKALRDYLKELLDQTDLCREALEGLVRHYAAQHRSVNLKTST